MSVDVFKMTAETEAMAILAFAEVYFKRYGHTPEARHAFLAALADAAARELSLIQTAHDRENAILAHCETIARATEEQTLVRRCGARP